MKRFLTVICTGLLLAAFTFFRLPEALLLLRLQDLGIPLATIPLAPGSHANAPLHADRSTAIRHIIIMDKENRSFDSMFGTFPGANGATTYLGADGKLHPLQQAFAELDSRMASPLRPARRSPY